MSLAAHNPIDNAQILSKATLNAGKALGLTQSDSAHIIGRSRQRMADGINPESKTGQLALYLIRIYRSLHALLGGDKEEMALWMHGENLGTGGVPAEQIKDITGLVRVMEYLDAMRGKT